VNTWFREPGALVLTALLLAAGPRPAGGGTQNDPELRAERTRGDSAAPVTIYEMSDFQCPFCAEFTRETLPALEREYVATGKVKIIFVNMPLPMHPNAEPAAELAMCAARQHKFWQMHDLLFRHQSQWARLEDPGPYFLALGDSVGADPSELHACLSTKATRALVRADFNGAVRSGAHSTPTFYIEGGLLIGAQPIEVFRSVLDSIVKVKTQRPAGSRR
jgi:protein-disulfide isomerase